jgi:dTDP-4-amino-4,6-dideoxygalactose transaminase
MSLPNFTWEAGRILEFSGRVAKAIRSNTPYNPDYDPKSPHHAVAVMHLAEYLVDLDRLGHALKESNLQTIEDTCNRLLSSYDKADAACDSEAIPFLEFKAVFTLNEGRAAIVAIRDMARTLRDQEQDLER